MDMQPTRSATSLTFLLKLFIHEKEKKKSWGQKKQKKTNKTKQWKAGDLSRPALVNLRKGNRVSCKYILDIGD